VSTLPRFGVIPTNGRDCVEAAVAALRPQVDFLVVIQAGQKITYREYPENVAIMTDEGPPNVCRWWNRGLDWAQGVATASGFEKWDVAIINDDVIVPEGWMCYVADDLRDYNSVAGCSGGLNEGVLVVHRAAVPVPLHQRIQGFAFVLVGESGLRGDEDMSWYFSDDDLGYRAAAAGGMAMKPGCHVQHLYPNAQVTSDIQVLNSLSAQAFVKKWGRLPW
jgi:hypothetical protein